MVVGQNSVAGAVPVGYLRHVTHSFICRVVTMSQRCVFFLGNKDSFWWRARAKSGPFRAYFEDAAASHAWNEVTTPSVDLGHSSEELAHLMRLAMGRQMEQGNGWVCSALGRF